MSRLLAICLRFPRGTYSGADLGVAEEIPSHARLHEALVAAAAGGPWGIPEGDVLVASAAHEEALEWLEQAEPVGVDVPPVRLNARAARRYRWRASPVAPADTDFEPLCAVGGPISYLWPAAPEHVVSALRQIAPEVTHVGRADSVALVTIDERPMPDGAGVHRLSQRRGPGRVLRVPRPGRTRALVEAHALACRPGRHGAGSLGRQASDLLVTGANPAAIEPRRFEPASAILSWPYAELWQLDIDASGASASAARPGPRQRVATAVAIHRALVQAIGDDVPSFVTGRDGDGPQRGAGHLAIHVARWPSPDSPWQAYLAIPHHVIDADRAQLVAALEQPLACGPRRSGAQRAFRLTALRSAEVVARGIDGHGVLVTDVPFVIDINGGPRTGGWTLDDAAMCSVGFALRGVLEERGVAWGAGWEFRRGLVALLRDEFGVQTRAVRVARHASAYTHRVAPSELVVAARAAVRLGDLAPAGGLGFLAIGRARHLGGGLLVPGTVVA